jgi:hypothetical protein
VDPRLERLRQALRKFSECKRVVAPVSAPLQHQCNETCEWMTFDDELYICQCSGAMHVCSLRECEYRSDAGPLGRRNGQGSHSVCMLTGIIREPIEFGMPEYGTRESELGELQPIKHVFASKPCTLAGRLRSHYERDHAEAKQIVLDLLANAAEDIPQTLAVDLATVCVRLWHTVHNKANQMLDKSQICKFPDLCLVLLFDMSAYGLRHCEEAGDSESAVTILPVHPFLKEWMPEVSEIAKITNSSTRLRYSWNINNSKCLHTAIASLEREQQVLLADEVSKLASFRGL